MARSLSAVANRVDGRLVGADANFGAVTTDSRSSAPGSLFVAIQGERFDGNDFVSQAAEHGAVGALVSRLGQTALPQIEVSDTRQAFGRMARAWRRNFEIPVVAVTGSAGKTTVKELIGSILAVGQKVCVTEGNLNNDIGVPLSLMRLEAADQAMVVELGANHAGEIANLGRLVEPTISVITNAGPAHLEGFGSIAGVAKAKGELLDCLSADGVAVLNADDAYYDDWKARAGQRRTISFGLERAADVHVDGEPEILAAGSRFTIVLPGGSRAVIELPLLGRANISNALAAAAAAVAAGASAAGIQTGLSQSAAVGGRMRPLSGQLGSTLIDDSYNANPGAARAALDYLGGRPGVRVFVLGDMLELGEDAAALHRSIGEYARARCDRFVTVGELAAEAAGTFGADASACVSIDQAVPLLRELLTPETTVLVKASRSMGLDRLVALLAEGEGGQPC